MERKRGQTKWFLMVILSMVVFLIFLFICALSAKAERQKTAIPLIEEVRNIAMSGDYYEGKCHVWIKMILQGDYAYYFTYCKAHNSVQMLLQLSPHAVGVMYMEETGKFYQIQLYRGDLVLKKEITFDSALEQIENNMVEVRKILNTGILLWKSSPYKGFRRATHKTLLIFSIQLLMGWYAGNAHLS